MSRTVTEWVLKLVEDITSPMRSVQNACSGASEAATATADSVDSIHETVSRMPSSAEKIGAAAFMFNQVTDAAGRMNGELKNAIAPGEQFQYALAEMSAITGLSGEGLEQLGEKAQDLAEKYGTGAAGSVESFKLLLSQLSPDLANNSEALGMMTENVMALSKTMGGDTTAAAEVLTTAMNQYGVSMDDPVAAAGEMTRMMNIMAAAAKEGSAELPAQKAALEQAGMAAKAANVSYGELSAAIQVLDKAGKKGSEGGVALRNVMTTLGQGRFLPKDVQEELAAAGVDINGLTDKSKSLSERLSLLKPIMTDDALLTKMFGKESQTAALALLNGTEQMDDWRVAIEGTNTAFDQATIIMDTNIEKQKRMGSWVDNLKIGFFNAIAPVTPFVTMMGDAVTGVSSFGFAVYGLSIVFKKELWTSVWDGIKGIAAFSKKCAVGAVSSVKFALTGGLSFNAFRVSAVSACRSVSLAISNIPILGWIAALIALIVAACVKFDDWGKYVLAFMGPVGWLVTGFISLKRNWQSIVDAFKTDGILGGIKRIGIVLLDFVLKPLQSILELIAKIPLVGKYAASGVESIKELRQGFNLTDYEDKKADSSEEKEPEGDGPAEERVAGSGFKIVDPVEARDGMVIDTSEIKPGSVTVAGAENKAVNLAGNGGGGSGGGRNVTMNVTFNQTFKVDGGGNIDGLAEQVMRVITGTLRDATVALS